MKDDLIPVLAPEAATERTKELFRLLRRSSLRCDELAPTEAPTEDADRWNERQDIQTLSRSEDPNKRTKIRSIQHTLNRLKTREIRTQYFDDANELRQLGHTTEHLVRGGHKVAATKSVTREVSGFFMQSSDGQVSSYIDLLLKYLDDKHYGQLTCFLCLATFDSWDAVWAYSNKKHASEAEWPLDCPECQRQGKDQRVRSLGEWCGHVHKSHAPSNKEPFRCLLGCKTFTRSRNLTKHLEKNHYEFWAVCEEVHCPTKFRRHLDTHGSSKHFPPLRTPLYTCLLCGHAKFSSQSALSRHTTVSHVKAEKTFAEPFHCRECRRLAQGDYLVRDEADWCNHVTECHGSANAPNPTALAKTRCLLCNTSLLNERAHFQSHYEKGQFDVPFSCPECVREGKKEVRIEDCQKCQLHCAVVHDRAVPLATRAGKTVSKGSRCLICDEVFAALKFHVTRCHEAGGYFDKPFPCPECARLGTQEPPLIGSRQAWLGHCASVHEDVSSATSIEGQSTDCAGDMGKEELLVELRNSYERAGKIGRRTQRFHKKDHVSIFR